MASKNVTSYDNKRHDLAAMKLRKFIFIGLLVITWALTIPVAAQQTGNPQVASAEELAKKTQNPVAGLIGVPFQNNDNFADGPKHNHMAYLLNIQPVIPIKINEEWNLISRTIMPIINLPLEGHAIAKLPINTQLQFFDNIARPEDAAKWQMRFQIQFLFPK